MVSTQYFCQNCKRKLNESQKPCPYCGNVKRDIKVEIKEEIKTRESLRERQKRKGFKKFMVEFLQGWFPSTNMEEFPEGVQKTRIINKKNDKYQEKVINEATREVMVNKDEKLSEHK
jgi:DNA-directed RNA polymerase subunit RPC12/RpoP